MWKWISRIAVGLAVVMMALSLIDRRIRRGPTLPPLPQPNAYADLLDAARQLTLPQGDLAELSALALREIAATNRAALVTVPAAVRAPSGVPLKTDRGWSDQHTADTRHLKRLAVALSLESRAQFLEGKTNASAHALLDVILLGQAMTRGGLLVDALNGLAVETIGAASLRSQLARLDAASCRAAAQELEAAEARREPVERILKTEKAWTAASFGLASRVGGWFLRKSEAQREAQFRSRYVEATRRTRRLLIALAARAVEFESGQRPTTTAALVPAVLKAVPVDPETGAPLTDVPSPADDPQSGVSPGLRP